MKNILIIDDEIGICSSLTFALEDKYKVYSTLNPDEGLEIIKNKNINLVLLDLKIGDVDGLEVLGRIKEINKEVIVIVMTAYGSILSSVEAMKKGAYTYLTKPMNLEELYIVIGKALEYQGMTEEIQYLNKELQNKYQYGGIIGKSEGMKKIFNLIEKLKDVETSVMITGESGTGKELVARAIHFSGKRKNNKFVEVNCAAIPEGLLEEEFFGHKKGTFTNAISDKIGKFQYANKGTIFLDEIGDMSLNLQSKLLRVIQEKSFIPLGANEPIDIDVRIIAATNKDLRKMVEEGTFRKDLYFRLNVIELKIPPLKDRKEDLPLLFNHFINISNKEMSKNVKGISKEVEKLLLEYDYPGNVRELSNIIECGVLLTQKEVIEKDSLPSNFIERFNKDKGYTIEGKDLTAMTLKEVEKLLIEVVLKRNNGHRKKTADMLGISERGLRNKINEYNL